MIDWVLSLPLVPAILLLWIGVTCRGGGTHLLGRGAQRLAHRGKVAELQDSEKVARAVDTINRFGAPIVALSFLTVGFQTAVQFASGLTRMPARRYVPALLIGALAWAVVYATVGLAAIGLWFQLFLRSPWAAVVLVLVVGLVVAALVIHRHRARSGTDRPADDLSGGPVPPPAA
jgi:membrane protein DedA with SNARE-associated domain